MFWNTDLMRKFEEVLVALRRVIRATDLHSRQLSKTVGLTAPQLLIMQTIRDLGQVKISTIARRVSLSQATVTTILDRLESRGLVYRERNETDKRKVHAHLTASGAELLEQAPMTLQSEFTTRFEALPEWEQSMIVASLQRVAEMMDAQDIDASPVLDVGAIDRADESTRH